MNVPRPSGTWADACAARCPRSACPSMRSPPQRISPLVRTMPQIARRVVVLPAPLAPSSAVTPPSSTTKSMPCSTASAPYAACSDRRPQAAPACCTPRLAEIGADHLRLVAHLLGRAVGDLQAELQRHHLVGDAHHQVHVMLDQQDAELELLADAPQQLRQLIHLAVIEPARRLVQHQQLRLADQRARQLDALLRAERQAAGTVTSATSSQVQQIAAARAAARCAWRSSPPHDRQAQRVGDEARMRRDDARRPGRCRARVMLRNSARFWKVRPMPEPGHAVARRAGSATGPRTGSRLRCSGRCR